MPRNWGEKVHDYPLVVLLVALLDRRLNYLPIIDLPDARKVVIIMYIQL